MSPLLRRDYTSKIKSFINKTNPLPNMWTCKHCSTEIEEDHFDVCWNCSTLKNPTEEELKAIEKRKAREKLLATPVPKVCLACNEKMIFHSKKDFHEGELPSFLQLRKGHINIFTLELYTCPRCREVKFYLPKKK